MLEFLMVYYYNEENRQITPMRVQYSYDNNSYDFVDDNGNSTGTADLSNLTFNMPGNDVEVSFMFQQKQAFHLSVDGNILKYFTIHIESESGEVVSENGADILPETTVYVIPQNDLSPNIQAVTLTRSDGENITLEIDSDSSYATFSMPSSDVTISYNQ